MTHVPTIFVSSAHYGLEDLRAALARDLEAFGLSVSISSDRGFPATEPTLPPYAQCIAVLENCSMVVGIVDRRYGTEFSDWGKYKSYSGLSPTHGEIRHALKKKIPLNVFVRKGLWTHYQSYRDSEREGRPFQSPNGYDLKSFELLKEIKLSKPAPWIDPFDDVRDIMSGLRRRFLGYMAAALDAQQKLGKAGAASLRKKIEMLDPAHREALEHAIDNDPQALNLLRSMAKGDPGTQVSKSRDRGPLAAPVEGNPIDKLGAYIDLASALLKVIL